MTSLPEAVRAETERLWHLIWERNTDLVARTRQIEALRDERDALRLEVWRLGQELQRLRGSPPLPGAPAPRAGPGIPLRALRPGDGIPR